MPKHDVLSLLGFFILLGGMAWPLAGLITNVFKGEIPGFLKFLTPVENLIYKLAMIRKEEEQKSIFYLRDLLIFNFCGLLFVLGILMGQGFLPLNPENVSGLPWHLAFNTAVSFMTNTNWQAYSGEASLSYFSQVLALTTQNFLSAATGFAILGVLTKGLTRKEDGRVGNFSVDVVRTTLYILIPLSVILAILLVGQGVIQNFSPYIEAVTLQGQDAIIPMGPAASQIAIKQLGTNGGGFFGMNSAHPFENPTPFSNLLQTLAIMLIPFAQVIAFGKMIGNVKQGYSLLMSMLSVLVFFLIVALIAEHSAGFLEGKEVRFGVTESTLWGIVTTAASNGSVNAMHSSFSPLAGLTFLFQLLTGEVIFGGVGAGLYGISLYAIITLFLAGLMVGRSPEWMGKKIEAYEVKLALIALLIPSAVILIGVSLGAVSPWGLSSLSHKGPHGLSELIYTFASTAGNNGSAFAGFNANTPFLNTVLGLAMLIGRFVVIIPVVLIFGNLSAKKITPASSGTFPTDGILFSVLLTGVIFVMGALTFFPLLVLGPIAEHLLMQVGMYL